MLLTEVYGKNDMLQGAWPQQIFLVGRASVAWLAMHFAVLTTAFCTKSVLQDAAGGEGGEATQAALSSCMGRASLGAC